jgi:S1-C subfamily serine protease
MPKRGRPHNLIYLMVLVAILLTPIHALARGIVMSLPREWGAGAPASSAGMYPPQPNFSTGSGFFISTNGMLVTNYHVVANSSAVSIFSPQSRQQYHARIVRTDPASDLALLQADMTSMPIPLASTFNLRRGEDVLTLGYPDPGIQGVGQKATFGRVNANTGVQDDIRFAQVDLPIQPGNSGGPLLNTSGEVVGIVTSGLRDGGKYQYQNVNYALKVDYLQRLLSGIPLPGKMSAATGPLSMTQIVERFEASVVMIIVLKNN